jgi:proline dehydrogenase
MPTTKEALMAGSAGQVESTLSTRIAGLANPAFRKGILLATHNQLVAGVVRRYGMRLGGARFVAGETLDEAVSTLRSLNEQGLLTNTTLLGEGVRDEAMARGVVTAYREILDRIAAEGLQTNVALKLTHLGLDIGEDVAFDNVAELVGHAARLGNFIRIDMEESTRVDATLHIYRALRLAGHDNVGTVLQSCLYRTERDLEELLPLQPNLRLVKGAYLEPVEVAWPKKADVDASYVRLAERMLSAIPHTAIATHDDQIIRHAIRYAKANQYDTSRYQIQMLYGIRTRFQLALAQRGYPVLVATPFGPEWYFYLMRRLAERPANLLFLFSNLRR